MSAVYLRVSTNGMPKDTLRTILTRLHGTGRKPLLTPEPIGGYWYVRFEDDANATRDAVVAVIEGLFVSCAPVAGLPGGKRMEWTPRPAVRQELNSPVSGFFSIFESSEVAAARDRSNIAMYDAATRMYNNMGR